MVLRQALWTLEPASRGLPLVLGDLQALAPAVTCGYSVGFTWVLVNRKPSRLPGHSDCPPAARDAGHFPSMHRREGPKLVGAAIP